MGSLPANPLLAVTSYFSLVKYKLFHCPIYNKVLINSYCAKVQVGARNKKQGEGTGWILL